MNMPRHHIDFWLRPKRHRRGRSCSFSLHRSIASRDSSPESSLNRTPHSFCKSCSLVFNDFFLIPITTLAFRLFIIWYNFSMRLSPFPEVTGNTSITTARRIHHRPPQNLFECNKSEHVNYHDFEFLPWTETLSWNKWWMWYKLEEKDLHSKLPYETNLNEEKTFWLQPYLTMETMNAKPSQRVNLKTFCWLRRTRSCSTIQ